MYDIYTSTGWKAGKRDKNSLQTNSDDLPAILDEAASEHRQPVAIEVTVKQRLPVFVAPGEPLIVNEKTDVETAGDASDVTSLRPAKTLNAGDTYVAVGLVSNASADDLRAAGTDYPSWVTDRYLQLPEDLPGDVAEAAREMAGQADTPYDEAANIEWALRHLQTELEATAPPSNVDAVQYFLDQGRGDPLLHASAMVVLLRSLGVPARLAVGFRAAPGHEQGRFRLPRRRPERAGLAGGLLPGIRLDSLQPYVGVPGGVDDVAVRGLADRSVRADVDAGAAGHVPERGPRQRRHARSKRRRFAGRERLRRTDAALADGAAAGPRDALAGLLSGRALCVESGDRRLKPSGTTS